MKHAVINLSGTQYQVSEGQTITTNSLNLEKGAKSSIDQVLLLSDSEDQNVKIGQPTIPNSSVDFEVINDYRGKKIKVATYKAKSRYRRHLGFRPQLTDIKILKINSTDAKTTQPKTTKVKSSTRKS